MITYNAIFKFIYRGNKIPHEGWKIHISSSIRYRKRVLRVVSRVCFDHNVSFKYIKSNYEFRKNISEYEKPWSLGKYITIYPDSPKKARDLMEILSVYLKNTEGPNIISDFKYKDSNNIFFRYGINTVNDKSDPTQFTLHGPNNESEQDIPHLSPYVPSWITVPQEWIVRNDDSLLIKKYNPYEIMSQKSTGNVYRGRDKNNNEVIIKEARLGTLKHGMFSTFFMRENEWINCDGREYLPKRIEKLKEGSSMFYVYQYVSGQTLDDFLSKNSFMLHSTNSKKVYLKILEVLNKISKIIIDLHDSNKNNIDIHANNFIIDNKENVYIIDLETINYLNYDIHSFGYWTKEMSEMSTKQKDVARFYLLIIYALSRQNVYLKMTSLYAVKKITYNYLVNIFDNSTLKELIDLDYSKQDISDIICKLNNLSFKGYVFERHSINSPSLTVLETFEKLKYQIKHNETPVIGVQGIASEIINLDIRKSKDMKKYEEIVIYLKSLIVTKSNLKFFRESKNTDVINPYVSRGIAGLLLAISTLQKELIPDFIVNVAYSVAIPYAKSSDYDHGLLGIADAVLSIAEKVNDDLLFGRGIKILDTCRMNVVEMNHKHFIPVMPSNIDPNNNIINPVLALKVIEDKWRDSYDQNFKK